GRERALVDRAGRERQSGGRRERHVRGGVGRRDGDPHHDSDDGGERGRGGYLFDPRPDGRPELADRHGQRARGESGDLHGDGDGGIGRAPGRQRGQQPEAGGRRDDKSRGDVDRRGGEADVDGDGG